MDEDYPGSLGDTVSRALKETENKENKEQKEKEPDIEFPVPEESNINTLCSFYLYKDALGECQLFGGKCEDIPKDKCSSKREKEPVKCKLCKYQEQGWEDMPCFGCNHVNNYKDFKPKEKELGTPGPKLSQAEKDVFSALDGDKKALKRLSENNLIFEIPKEKKELSKKETIEHVRKVARRSEDIKLMINEKDGEPFDEERDKMIRGLDHVIIMDIDLGEKEIQISDLQIMRKKLREDLDKSLVKQRKDHPRIEINLINEFIKSLKSIKSCFDKLYLEPRPRSIILENKINVEIEGYKMRLKKYD